jgi:hypothetical protein
MLEGRRCLCGREVRTKKGNKRRLYFSFPAVVLVASLIPPRSQKSGLQGSWSPAELIPHDHLLHVIRSRKARMRMCVAYATVASSRQMIGMQCFVWAGVCSTTQSEHKLNCGVESVGSAGVMRHVTRCTPHIRGFLFFPFFQYHQLSSSFHQQVMSPVDPSN